MKKLAKRMMSMLLVVLMVAGIFAALSTTASAASYTYNSGKRGTTCTSLSSKAKAYWTGSYAYSTLKAKTASALRTTLRTKVSSGSTVGYNGLRTYMKYTDAYQGSTSKLMLFYSSGTTTSTWDSGKTWNREHMWPQSLGGNAVEGDLHAMRPADPTANSSRNNNKYGEVASGYTTFKTSSKNGSLVCGYYKDSIFEPLDNVKGDCARVVLYDYMKASSMSSVTKVFSSASTLLSWCKSDPVDTYEMSRNDSVESIQGNRNPFVDYPELGWVILGYSIPSGMTTPSGGAGSSSGSSSGSNSGSNSGSTGTTTTTTTSGTGGTYTKVTSTSGLTSGGKYLIVSGSKVFNGSLSTLDAANNYVTANTSGSNILANSKYSFTITKSGSYYTIKANSGKYIGRSSNANGMNSSSSSSYNNTITFNSNGTVNIKGSGGAYLRFNSTSGQMRFRYFKSSSYSGYDAIYLYKLNDGSSSGGSSGGSSSGSSSSSSSTTFTKITSTSSIGSGKYILIVKAGGSYKGSYNYYALTRQATNTSYVLATGLSWSSVPSSVTCDPSSTMVWTATGSASAWKLSNGGSSVLRSSSTSLYYGSGTASSWTVSYSSGTFKLKNGSYYLGLRDDLSGTGTNGCPRFRCNKSASTTSFNFYIFKQS